MTDPATRLTPTVIAAVLTFLRKLSVDGKATKQTYNDNRPDDLPSTSTLYQAGLSFNELMQAAGLTPNVPGKANRGKWLDGFEDDAVTMTENRALDVYHSTGLPVVESTLRTEQRQVILPGGVPAVRHYEIVSLR